MTLPNWHGETVFMLGGGSSVPEQFGVPREVQRQVKAGELPMTAYSPYMKELMLENVIGINAAFLFGDWVDILFFGDEIFWRNYRDKIDEFPNQVITCCESFKDYMGKINYFTRVREKSLGISDKPGTVAWNYNSGCAALSVAVQAGAKRIVLLGYDMTGDVGKSHFHSEYFWQNRTPSYELHLRGMAAIARDAKELGVEILNASPVSVIKQFKKININQLW